MEKQKLIIGMTLIPLLLITFGMVYANDGYMNNDFDECVKYLGLANKQIHVDWDDSQIQTHCANLINDGQVLIQRENQRDIMIFMIHVRETLAINLN